MHCLPRLADTSCTGKPVIENHGILQNVSIELVNPEIGRHCRAPEVLKEISNCNNGFEKRVTDWGKWSKNEQRTRRSLWQNTHDQNALQGISKADFAVSFDGTNMQLIKKQKSCRWTFQTFDEPLKKEKITKYRDWTGLKKYFGTDKWNEKGNGIEKQYKYESECDGRVGNSNLEQKRTGGCGRQGETSSKEDSFNKRMV